MTLLVGLGLSSAQAASLKVLTLNVYRKPEPFGLGGSHAAKRIKRLCLELKVTDYDVVLLQEAWLAKDRKFLEKCGYPFVMNIGVKAPSDWPGRGARAGREQNLESGLLILSRHPFIERKRVNYDQRGNLGTVFRDGERLASKAAYAARIETADGQKVWLVNTHLVANYCESYPRMNCQSYEDERASQLEQLSYFVAKLEGPIIMGGDFNMGPKPLSRDLAWQRFDDFFPGFLQAPHDPSRNSTSSISNNFNYYDMGKIDHLFGSKELRAVDGHLVFNQLMNINNLSLHLSDHFGWETTFYFD